MTKTTDKERRRRNVRELEFDQWLANVVYWLKSGGKLPRKERKQ